MLEHGLSMFAGTDVNPQHEQTKNSLNDKDQTIQRRTRNTQRMKRNRSKDKKIIRMSLSGRGFRMTRACMPVACVWLDEANTLEKSEWTKQYLCF